MVFGWNENQQASAAESAVVESTHDKASLVTDYDTVGANQSLKVGLRLQLKPGWHTYWINPGDAGDAPTLDIAAQGATIEKSSNIIWPTPDRLSDSGLMSYVYMNDVLLPKNLTLQGAGLVTLKAHAEWLVCAQVCIPEHADFILELPRARGTPKLGRQEVLFNDADKRTPRFSPFQALITSDGVLNILGNGLSSKNVADAWFMPESGGIIEQNAPQKFSVKEKSLSLHLRLLKESKLPKSLKGVLVLKDPANVEAAFYIEVENKELYQSNILEKQDTVSKQVSSKEWFHIFLFAFIGGLILNLMPCVFPVLAMKAFSLVNLGSKGRDEQLKSALYYTLGVVGSFVILGILMIGLRLVGSAAGWGFQFQSAGFVVSICWLLFVMALNLLGVFEITSGALGRVNPQATGRLGDLITGSLAVVVATPCTAPFMGVAIAGALSGPILVGMLVFIFMGFGLATPYIAIASSPNIARLMPKPGPWMGILRQALSFPLLATCVWLLWVAVMEAGGNVLIVAAGGLVLLGLAAWLYGVAQQRMMRGGEGSLFVLMCRLIAVGCIVLCCVGLVKGVMAMEPLEQHVIKNEGNIQSFSPSKLADLRAQGVPVLVDMTASWCITCMVNEQVVLDTPRIQQFLSDHHVVYMKGDWTNQDKNISEFLKKYNRSGVPLYVYYPPYKKEVVLPQILTSSIIQNYIH
ncbi:cytochrome C biogenesis protein [Swingsia samuiensis]|uniref:Cytochrome C biogenesis protein n=2 Tax=Swingsia samuiensis TaxID=1293412 RepID=A0A4Y6UNN5_9PROT|nr:cytochrome C biogenesis protein [Swingsia samuiensis]